MSFNVYVLLGDGELQEGQVWEAAMYAGRHELTGLVAVVDYNKVQLAGTVPELFARRTDRSPNAVAYSHFDRTAGRWIDTSWAEHAASVARVSRSLIALDVKHGDCVSILAQSRQKWVECDIGIVNIRNNFCVLRCNFVIYVENEYLFISGQR